MSFAPATSTPGLIAALTAILLTVTAKELVISGKTFSRKSSGKALRMSSSTDAGTSNKPDLRHI